MAKTARHKRRTRAKAKATRTNAKHDGRKSHPIAASGEANGSSHNSSLAISFQNDVYESVHKSNIGRLVDIERERAKLKKSADAIYATCEKQGLSKTILKCCVELRMKEQDANTHAKNRIEKWLVASALEKLDVANQLDLFAPRQRSRDEEIFDHGFTAGLNDALRIPPDHYNQQDQQTWMKGHMKACTERNQELGKGFLPIEKVPPEEPVPIGVAAAAVVEGVSTQQ